VYFSSTRILLHVNHCMISMGRVPPCMGRSLSQLLKSFFLLRPLEGVRVHGSRGEAPACPEPISWKVAPVQQLLCQRGTRVVVISGPPCSGKTSSMAALMQTLQDQGTVSACHYCKQSDSRTVSTVSLVRTLAFGLALQHTELQVWDAGSGCEKDQHWLVASSSNQS
jgi:hypothetical protein